MSVLGKNVIFPGDEDFNTPSCLHSPTQPVGLLLWITLTITLYKHAKLSSIPDLAK